MSVSIGQGPARGPRVDQVDDNQRYLATYVGEVDGTLGAALENVSKLCLGRVGLQVFQNSNKQL